MVSEKSATIPLCCSTKRISPVLQILQLRSLQTLDLSNTGLSSLPEGFTALRGLEELLLGACRFQSIPTYQLRQLPALRKLDMSRNSDLELQQLSIDDLMWLVTGTLNRLCPLIRACGSNPLPPLPAGSWLTQLTRPVTFLRACMHAGRTHDMCQGPLVL